MRHKIILVSVAVLILSLMLVYPLSDLMSQNRNADTAALTTKDSIAVAFSQLPILFIKNQGQLDKSVAYYVKTSVQTLYFTENGVTFDLTRYNQAEAHNIDNKQAQRLEFSLDFLGASSKPYIEGSVKNNALVNYFFGNDPKKWRTDIPTYTEVVYHDVYPSIDLTLRGKDNVLEYEFVVRPGANPDEIALTYNGINSLSIRNDDLLIGTAFGPIRQDKPYIYQQIGNETVNVAGGFKLGRCNTYGFYVAAYDNRYPLVIDPTLAYSTYLGGTGNDQGFGIAVDQAGSAYITGFTNSTDFPTQDPFQGTYGGNLSDAFVTKLSPAGNSLVYSTYLGGNGIDEGHGIAVDAAGSAYVTGTTSSPNFPTQNAFQGTSAGGFHAFVTKLSPAGNSLAYSTYLGGSGADAGSGIAVDSTGCAYVAGYTGSTDFPTKNPWLDHNAGSIDAFVTKLSRAGNSLIYSTYFGGHADDYGDAIAVDSSGSAYIVGTTNSDNLITWDAFQPTKPGVFDAFVIKLSPAGSSLVYSTYLGGTGADTGNGIAVDLAGSAYVTGFTDSTDFPTQNPYQGTNAGGVDAYVTKLSPAGNSLVYSTYLGGSDSDTGNGIAVDAADSAYVTGFTGSVDFPTQTPIQGTNAGGLDAFVARLSASGNSLAYSTYLGGSQDDEANGIAVDAAGNAYVTGFTNSSNFPTNNPHQGTFAGVLDAFVAKLAQIQPTVTTNAATNVGINSATLNMSFTVGEFSAVEVRFAYKMAADSTWTYTSWVSKSAAGTYADTVTGLLPGMRYNFKAQLTYASTLIEGDTLQFNTSTLPAQPRVSPSLPRQLNPAQMSLEYLNVSPQQTYANQPVTIATNVVNTGDEAGNLNVALKINGQVEQTRMISVGPQATQPVKFTITEAQPGTYTVDIGQQEGSFTVLGAGGATGKPVNGGIVILIAMVGLILATAVVLMMTFRRSA